MLRLTALSAQAPLLALSLFTGPEHKLLFRALLQDTIAPACNVNFLFRQIWCFISYFIWTGSPCVLTLLLQEFKLDTMLKYWWGLQDKPILLSDWQKLRPNSQCISTWAFKYTFLDLACVGTQLKIYQPSWHEWTWTYPEIDLQTFFTIVLWSLSIPY